MLFYFFLKVVGIKAFVVDFDRNQSDAKTFKKFPSRRVTFSFNGDFVSRLEESLRKNHQGFLGTICDDEIFFEQIATASKIL